MQVALIDDALTRLHSEKKAAFFGVPDRMDIVSQFHSTMSMLFMSS